MKTSKIELNSCCQRRVKDQNARLLARIFIGLCIGLATGAIISVFRISTDFAFRHVVNFVHAPDHTFLTYGLFVCAAVLAALVVGKIIHNPAMSFGGEDWIKHAILDGQPRVWRKILLPKFIGSWLVMAGCVSVGREGPCIEMGAATAEGFKRLDPQNVIDRRHYILAGCAAGLAAAFSAPFAGICYVYEIMREKLDSSLFIFMLAAGFGVYLSCTQIFGLDVLLPLGDTPMPSLAFLWTLLPLGIVAGLIGMAYRYLLKLSIRLYARRDIIPLFYRPLFAFGGAAIMVMFCPALSGEGLTIFPGILTGQTAMAYLCIFVIAKLFFTAYCYGSFIPAGLMVPIICLGGVGGGIYADIIQTTGLLGSEYVPTFIAMGMAGAFAAAERAPITAIILIAEMTGAWTAILGMLLVAAIGAFMARMA